MSPYPNKSLTLLELLIAITLIGVVALGFFSIDLFSRHQVISSERLIIVQSDVSYILDHMQKEISKAVGNERIDGVDNVIDIDDHVGWEMAGIKIYIDANGNGRRDPLGYDRWINYRFMTNIQQTPPHPDEFVLEYCGWCQPYQDEECAACWLPVGTPYKISRRILNCTFFKPKMDSGNNNMLTDNYIGVNITACWDPHNQTRYLCGTPDNPAVTMQRRINMPAVSTN